MVYKVVAGGLVVVTIADGHGLKCLMWEKLGEALLPRFNG